MACTWPLSCCIVSGCSSFTMAFLAIRQQRRSLRPYLRRHPHKHRCLRAHLAIQRHRHGGGSRYHCRPNRVAAYAWQRKAERIIAVSRQRRGTYTRTASLLLHATGETKRALREQHNQCPWIAPGVSQMRDVVTCGAVTALPNAVSSLP